MQRLLTLTLRLSAVFLIASGISWAQHDAATVTGTVTEASGAVLPSANVTVTNVDTKLMFKGVSNQDGIYSIPNLPIGDYTLDITHRDSKRTPYRICT
ncbi:MAG: carboxypeptidase-like regulatory domain-containing protein [Candidatus Sulfotelmatobacter sp.]